MKNCPWGPWAGRFLAILFALMFVCLVFDRDATKVMNVLGWLMLAMAAVTDRHGHRVRQILPVAAAVIIVFASAGAAAWFFGDFPAAVNGFVKYQVGVVWLALLWVIAPVFLNFRGHGEEESRAERVVRRWVLAMMTLLLLFAFHATLSAAASLFPKDSMELLGAEVLPYAGMFVIITRSACCLQARWWHVGARAAWLLVVLSSVAMAVIALLALMSPSMAETMLDAEFFRIDSDAPGTRRLQFLFHHHNRAGFFAAAAIFLCIAGAWGGRKWRVLGIAGAACAAFALPFTLTRGALLAAAVGMVIFAAMGMIRHRRLRWILAASVIILAPLLWFGLPDRYQEHIAKIANPANYQEGVGGSIGARLIMWETAGEMIEKRPVLGFGYGFENFESAARLYHPGRPHFFEGASHAHNLWLETAAESGIPGAILLFLFTLLRVVALAAAWWRAMRSGHTLAWLLLLWLCLELMIQVYGLTNYTLRRNLGYLTYWIWAGSAVLVIFSTRQKHRQFQQ